MKKVFPLMGWSLLACVGLSAQNTFSDDFESYTAGQFIGTESPQFTTWSNAPGGTEDVRVVNTDAHSGVNSLYLSSTATNGGPQDLLLPFGSTITSGHFTLKMALKIQTGKKGYFNLQKTATPGTVWTADVTFDAGSMNVVSGGTELFRTPCPQNTWFELRFEIDVNNSRYKVYIDNQYKGSFHNAEFQFASTNIFAIAQSGFWVDDVAYTYTPFTAPAVNAAVSYINGVTGGLVGQAKTPVVTVRNLGTTAINSLKINVSYNGSSYSQAFTSLNIAAGGQQNLTLQQGVVLAAGPLPITVYTSDVNSGADTNPADDTASISLTPITPAAGRVVIAEEGTGTWCGWCPRGAVTMARVKAAYPDHFQGIAVHNGDPMVVSAYDSGLGISSFPGAKVDRVSVIDPANIETGFIPQVQVPASAFLKVGADWDAGTRKLKVSVSYNFQTEITGNWKAALAIVENGVKGTGSGWAQKNYYAGGSEGPMGGYEALPNPVPAAQMVYDDVARLILPSFAGQPNSFPSPSATGSTHTLNFEVDVPAAWNPDNLHLVGMLIKPNGRIDNAGTATITQAVANGYVNGSETGNASVEELGQPDAAFTVFPNPTSDYSMVKIELQAASEVRLSVRDLGGKELFSRNYGVLNGAQILPIHTETLAQGIYLLELHMNGKRYAAKLLKQ